jgi:peptide deformylase
MSEVLTFNTESGIVQEEEVLPLQVLDENFPGLSAKLPEVDVTTLPNNVVTNLVKRLKMTMKLYNGLGLSANQCGIMERIFVIGTDQFQIACINPKIVSLSEDRGSDLEGCLSFPDLFMKVKRPTSAVVQYYTVSGELVERELTGLECRVFLHEYDHLIGVTFNQRVGNLSFKMAKDKRKKELKKLSRKD